MPLLSKSALKRCGTCSVLLKLTSPVAHNSSPYPIHSGAWKWMWHSRCGLPNHTPRDSHLHPFRYISTMQPCCTFAFLIAGSPTESFLHDVNNLHTCLMGRGQSSLVEKCLRRFQLHKGAEVTDRFSNPISESRGLCVSTHRVGQRLDKDLHHRILCKRKSILNVHQERLVRGRHVAQQ